MSFNGETVWKFQTKKTPKTPIFALRTNKRNHKTPMARSEHEPCSQEEKNRREIEKKAFSLKLLDPCKTRSNKSSPDTFNFYVILAGHEMITDAGRATTIRRNFIAPWLPTKVQNMHNLSKTWVFTAEVWRFQTKKRTKTKFLTLQKNTVEHTAPKYNN